MATKVLTTYDGIPYDSISEAVQSCVDGDNYDTGALEAAARTADNVAMAFGNLVQLLESKGMITEQEIQDDVLSGVG